MQFLIDAMLGNVAKKLRLLGYDSEYFSDIDDSELLEKAKNENRILVSKDKELVARSKKIGISSIHVSKENEVEQFLEILKIVPLQLDVISGDTARCPKCNSVTFSIAKSEIQEKIPQKVLEFNDEFWKCGGCSQIYWEGTHIANLQDFLHKIKSQS